MVSKKMALMTREKFFFGGWRINEFFEEEIIVEHLLLSSERKEEFDTNRFTSSFFRLPRIFKAWLFEWSTTPTMEWSSSSSWSTLTTGLKHSNNLFLETFFMSIVVCNTKDLMGINKGTLLIITTIASKLFKDCCSS